MGNWVIFLPDSWHGHIAASILVFPRGNNSYQESGILWKFSSIFQRMYQLRDIGYWIIMNSLIKSGPDNMWMKLKKNKMLYFELNVQTWCPEEWMTNLCLMLAEECFIRKIQSQEGRGDLLSVLLQRRKVSGPSEHFYYEKAVTIKLVAIHWALIELWKGRFCKDGCIKLQRYFNKFYLKVLRIFCKMVYTFEL